VPRLLAAGPQPNDATGLPATFRGLAVRGNGRLAIRATARLEDGRMISGSLASNVLPEGLVPGSAQALLLQLRPATSADDVTGEAGRLGGGGHDGDSRCQQLGLRPRPDLRITFHTTN
jgi:hypothetical protein